MLAALCPHLEAKETSCATGTEHSPATHHTSVEAEDSRDSDLLEMPNQHADCTHCVVHSRTRRDESARKMALVSQRTDYQDAAVVVLAIPSIDVSKSTSWAAKSHGPPAVSVSLHVLINIFRI